MVYRQHNCPDHFLDYLSSKLETLCARNNEIILLGDFNIDLLKIESCDYSQKLFETLQSLSLLPTIDKPTRSYGSSATLIDNIFINSLDKFVLSGNIVSDISDHYSQVCFLSSNLKIISNSRIRKRDLSSFNQTDFNNDLELITWPPNSDADCAFNVFYNKLNRLVDKHAPFKTVSRRKSKQMAKPWITKGLLTSIRKKNKLYHDGLWDEYKLYRNKLSLLTRLSKRNYYNSFFELNLNNMKATWEGINNLISTSKKKVNQISIIKKPDGSLSTDPSEISNVLNKHFASVGHNLASKLPPSKHSFNEYLTNNRLPNSFNFEPIIPTDISAQIQALPLYKSYGMFSCPVKILKGCKHIISQPLANIYNLSVIQGKHPSKLKLAKDVTVYKDDDESCASSYRPISLLSTFNRVSEKLMYQRVSKFIIRHNIFITVKPGQAFPSLAN